MPPGTRPDDRLNAIAAVQHGVVSRRQGLEAGLSPAGLNRRVAMGRLRILHRGVYEVGGPVRAPLAGAMASVLACGARSVVSHRSAAALWKLPVAQQVCPPNSIEVTVPRCAAPRRPGIRAYRSRRLEPDEITTFAGIPVTTAARTLLDLAGVESAKVVERALAEAVVQKLTTARQVAKLLDRYPNRPGSAVLRALVNQDHGPEAAFTRSEAERCFRDLVRRAELPMPEANVRLVGAERDFVWREQELVVEIDGYRYHSARHRFEDDKRRDADLIAAGFRPLRFTWRQLEGQAEYVVARVAQALAR